MATTEISNSGTDGAGGSSSPPKEQFEPTCSGHSEDLGREQTMLISFESGHYKKVAGKWKGDTIWTHWIKKDGKCIHINKEKVEYYEEL